MHLLTPCTGLLCYPLPLILSIISWMTRDDLSLASCVGCSQLACSAPFWCLLHSALSLQPLSDILFHFPHGLVLLAEDPLFNVSNKYWKIASCNDSGYFFWFSSQAAAHVICACCFAWPWDSKSERLPYFSSQNLELIFSTAALDW